MRRYHTVITLFSQAYLFAVGAPRMRLDNNLAIRSNHGINDNDKHKQIQMSIVDWNHSTEIDRMILAALDSDYKD